MTESITRAALIRQWLSHTFSGRALVAGAALKLIVAALRLAVGPGAMLSALDTIGDVALIAGAGALAYRLFVDVKRVVLWRVRRKLMLSYVFIGFIPALLIIAFFLIGGLLLFFNVSAYALRTGLAAVVDEDRFLAESTALELESAHTDAEVGAVLARRQAAATVRYPRASYVVVPRTSPCGGSAVPGVSRPIPAGPWTHLAAPAVVPAWVPCDGYAGLVAYTADGRTRIAARAVAATSSLPGRAVIVDVPIDARVVQKVQDDAGVEIETMTALGNNDDESDAPRQPYAIRVGPANIAVSDRSTVSGRLQWVAFLDHMDWQSGRTGTLLIAFRMSPVAVYDRISVTSIRRVGNFSFGQLLLFLLAIVAALFFLIQFAAFMMGLALARSITGSVHALFAGTERVRRGDFTHKIPIRSRDQLGELAASFNSMTSSIEDLLQEKAEKERLEQELRVARSIQMSLLPQAQPHLDGLSLTAHCEPAREVGGDYYDYLPLGDRRLALLIADVAGKGTSAALYMAELKGIILSLNQRHESPRDLLIDADRILARHLNTCTFITITYAMLDLDARTLTYARAGHCPLIYRPGPYAPDRRAQVMMPDGMVLGLNLDDGEMFRDALVQTTLPLGDGDLVLLYTDGITEAMNADGDCFGEARLGSLVEEHGDLPSEELRERILREVRSFAGTAVQQDDMTMLIVRMEEAGAAAWNR